MQSEQSNIKLLESENSLQKSLSSLEKEILNKNREIDELTNANLGLKRDLENKLAEMEKNFASSLNQQKAECSQEKR